MAISNELDLPFTDDLYGWDLESPEKGLSADQQQLQKSLAHVLDQSQNSNKTIFTHAVQLKKIIQPHFTTSLNVTEHATSSTFQKQIYPASIGLPSDKYPEKSITDGLPDWQIASLQKVIDNLPPSERHEICQFALSLCSGLSGMELGYIVMAIRKLPVNDRTRIVNLVVQLASHLRSPRDSEQVFSLIGRNLEVDWDSIIQAMTLLWKGVYPVSCLDIEKIKLIPFHLRMDVIQAAVESVRNSPLKRTFEDVMVNAWLSIYGENDPIHMLCKDCHSSDKWKLLKIVQELEITERERLCRMVARLAPHLQSTRDIEELFSLLRRDTETDWESIIQAVVLAHNGLGKLPFCLIQALTVVPPSHQLAVVQATVELKKKDGFRTIDVTMIDAWVGMHDENDPIQLFRGLHARDVLAVQKTINDLPFSEQNAICCLAIPFCRDWGIEHRKILLNLIKKLSASNRERLCKALAPLTPGLKFVWYYQQLFELMNKAPQADWENIIQAAAHIFNAWGHVSISLIEKIALIPSLHHASIIQTAFELKRNNSSHKTDEDILAKAWISFIDNGNDKLKEICKNRYSREKWDILQFVERLIPEHERKTVLEGIAHFAQGIKSNQWESALVNVLETPAEDREAICQGLQLLYIYSGNLPSDLSPLFSIFRHIPAERRELIIPVLVPYVNNRALFNAFLEISFFLPVEILRELSTHAWDFKTLDTKPVSGTGSISDLWSSNDELKSKMLAHFQSLLTTDMVLNQKEVLVKLLISHRKAFQLDFNSALGKAVLDIFLPKFDRPLVVRAILDYSVELNISPLDPVRNNSIKPNDATKWISMHPPQCQKAVKVLIDHVQCIDKDRFNRALAQSIIQINKMWTRVQDKDYAVLVAESKSNIWVTEKALKSLDHLPKNAISVTSGYKYYLEEELKKYDKSAPYYFPKNIVLFDDCIYSGEQMSGLVWTCMKNTIKMRNARPDVHIPIPDIYVVPVFATQFGIKNVLQAWDRKKSEIADIAAEDFKDKVHVVPHERIDTLAEVLKDHPDDLKMVNSMYWKESNMDKYEKGAHSRTLTYFAHKIPDNLSFVQAIANGFIYNENGDCIFNKSQMIPETVPPYKPEYTNFCKSIAIE